MRIKNLSRCKTIVKQIKLITINVKLASYNMTSYQNILLNKAMNKECINIFNLVAPKRPHEKKSSSSLRKFTQKEVLNFFYIVHCIKAQGRRLIVTNCTPAAFLTAVS